MPVPEPVRVNTLVSSLKLEEPGLVGLLMSTPMKSAGVNVNVPCSPVGVTVTALEAALSPYIFEAVTTN
ncbi:hypothetical protein D3C75_1207250 [compost metagenome]